MNRLSEANLLAFGFANSAMLGWLALAAIPILIHWLFRRRYREVVWGAMQFLHEAVRKQSRRARLEQLLLLLVRISLLALIVLSLAGPRWSAALSASKSLAPTLRVIVLDCSLSMSRQAAKRSEATLLDAAKQQARDVVGRAASGDRLALARIAGSEPRVLIRQPALLPRAVLDEIDRTNQTFERGDVKATLRAVQEVVASRRAGERCEVTIHSDFQADNWADVDLTELAAQCLIEFVDAGPAAPNNGAVVGLEIEPTIVTPGQTARVIAAIRQFGATPLSSRRTELLLNGQVVEAQTIDSDDDDVRREFWLTVPEAGEHILSARLDDDSLPADNEYWRALSVRSEVRVLLLNGRSGSRSRDSATFYVERALAPDRVAASRSSADRRFPWRVQSLPESSLSQTDLAEFDVVFVCDPPRLTETDVGRLRRFMTNGGGLIVSLGPSADLANLNETIAGPQGLLPVRLLNVVGPLESNGIPSGVGFELADETHPLLREFRGHPGTGLETALIRQFVRAEMLPQSAAQIPIKFTSGEPAVITHRTGAGRIVMITTSVDERWGAWAVFAPGFVPLMHEMVQFVVPSSSGRDTVLVGDSISLPLRSTPVEVSVVAEFGDEEQRPIRLLEHDGVTVAAIAGQARPGVLRVKQKVDDRVLSQIAVNLDPRESDPRRMNPDSWKSQSNQASEIVTSHDRTSLDRSLVEAEPSLSVLARLGLLLVWLMLVAELLLAWRFVAAGWFLVVVAAGMALGVGVVKFSFPLGLIAVVAGLLVIGGVVWFKQKTNA